MAIVSYDFYTNTFMGLEVAEENFPQYNAFAQRAVLLACMGRVTENNFSALPNFQQDAVKNAICAQISAYEINGLDEAITGDSSSNFTVGKVSVGRGSSSAYAAGHASLLCPLALSDLEQSGLLNPQVDALGNAFCSCLV